MGDFFVSPNYRLTQVGGADIAKKIDIFEDQMNGWLLTQARMLASAHNPGEQHAGYAILALCFVYVEGIACFIKGESSNHKSQEFFQFGMEQIFFDLDKYPRKILDMFSNEFYGQARSGLLHQGLTRGKIAITKNARNALCASYDLQANINQIVVDPWLFLNYVEKHFSAYLSLLRNPREESKRTNFEKWFDQRA